MYWEQGAAASRILLYLCTAITLGLVLCNWLAQRHRLSAPLSRPGQALVFGLGAFSVLSSFLLQVGTMAMAGMGGMFDWELMQFLWPDAAGKTLCLQLPAFGLLLLSLLLLKVKYLPILLQSMALLLLMFGFLQGGHLLRFGLPGQLLLLTHLLAVGFWVGSLPLLWRLCRHSPTARLHALLHQFGQIMIGVLLLILLSGVSMTWLLLSAPEHLWSTSYGQLLLAKILLVIGLLSLGALNKLRLVPALQQHSDPRRLQMAIVAEMLLATAIFVITAVVTVIVGWSG